MRKSVNASRSVFPKGQVLQEIAWPETLKFSGSRFQFETPASVKNPDIKQAWCKLEGFVWRYPSDRS